MSSIKRIAEREKGEVKAPSQRGQVGDHNGDITQKKKDQRLKYESGQPQEKRGSTEESTKRSKEGEGRKQRKIPRVQSEAKDNRKRSHRSGDAVSGREGSEGQQATKMTMRKRRFSTTK